MNRRTQKERKPKRPRFNFETKDVINCEGPICQKLLSEFLVISYCVLEVINLPEKEAKELDLKEVGVKLIIYGIKYSDPHNKELILKMAEAIKKEAHPIRNSPARPIVYIILPRSAYDYG
jgi:hypothetical protein